MSTLATLLESLATARRQGEPFESAWAAASALALGASCDAADWSEVLRATETSWRRSYERMPSTRTERALTLLAEDLELVDGDVARCRRCDRPIPVARFKRAPAVYCTDQCRRAWHAGRARVAA